MANAQKLSQSELATALTDLDGWSVEEGKLHREFRFADFTAAFGFMTKVAIEANTMDHHPEFFNVWNKVVIDLVTHEADDSISNLDVELARTIDKLAG